MLHRCPILRRTPRLAIVGLMGLLLIALLTGWPAPSLQASPPLAAADSFACLPAHTGSVRSVFRISHPIQVSEVAIHSLANWEQHAERVSETVVEVTVEGRLYLPTHAPYPVPSDQLSPEAQAYLLPDFLAPSDDEDIRALAEQLVSGQATEAGAVRAILAWVGSHITYDPAAASSALDTLSQREGNAEGRAYLSTALLRAAGIPARTRTGTVVSNPVLGRQWTTDPAGSAWHWVEHYYPDVGWAASDPGGTLNWLDSSHLLGVREAMISGATIERDQHDELVEPWLAWHLPADVGLQAEAVTAAGPPLSVQPGRVQLLLPLDEAPPELLLTIREATCTSHPWKIAGLPGWLRLRPGSGTGTGDGVVRLEIVPGALRLGRNAATLRLLSADGQSEYQQVPVVVIYGQEQWQVGLPLVRR